MQENNSPDIYIFFNISNTIESPVDVYTVRMKNIRCNQMIEIIFFFIKLS